MLGLAVAGCGDDGDDGAGPAETQVPTETTESPPGSVPADPCQLLSDAEVAGEIGKGAESDATEGDTRDGFPYSECTWSVTQGGLVATKLTLAVIGSSQRFEERTQDEGAEPVDELGDGAVAFTGRFGFELVDPGELGGGTADTERLVFVRSGDRTLIVELNLITVRDQADLIRRAPNERLARIATAALGRLDELPPDTGSAAAIESLVACLEQAGLDGVSGDEDTPFDEVEFEIAATAGEAVLAGYAYGTPAEARDGDKTFNVDPDFYPSRGVEGRVLVLYGKGFPADLKPNVAACLAEA